MRTNRDRQLGRHVVEHRGRAVQVAEAMARDINHQAPAARAATVRRHERLSSDKASAGATAWPLGRRDQLADAQPSAAMSEPAAIARRGLLAQ